jgi:phytoene desaturase
LAAACILGKAGYQVTVLEKNEQMGGRASVFRIPLNEVLSKSAKKEKLIGLDCGRGEAENRTESYISYDEGESQATTKSGAKSRSGIVSNARKQASVANEFVFDMGPSWYLMPDVFEHFFNLMDENIEDYISLKRLSPSYRIFFKDVHDKPFDIFGNSKKDAATFEALESGSSKVLKEYLERAEYIYNTAIDKFLYKNYDSVKDFLSPSLAKEAGKLALFSNMDRYVRKYFKSPEIQKILQYPLVFLGSSPYNAPAIYSLMSHVDFNQGVFYPNGGFGHVVKALEKIAKKHNVKLETNAHVTKIITKNGQAVGVKVGKESICADIIVSDADPYHTEQTLLTKSERDHSDKYWSSRTLAPSALLMYIGVKGSLPQLLHHNLIFSNDWKQNFGQIFANPQFPEDPSLYISNPSKTDATVAPPGYENIFVLVPIASGLTYSRQQLDAYADKILQTIEQEAKIPDLRDRIVYQRLFCVNDFESRYNSFKGTGLGLAHTLKQTAVFRPKNVSKKVKNLYYVGANTHPGIGVPITLISAELLAKRLKI